MGYLPVVVGIEDSAGARADAKRADGNRSAIILRFSNMFTASSEADGGITRVFIGSSIAAIDGAGVLTIGASATSIIIGGAGIPVSVPDDFSVGGIIGLLGGLKSDPTTIDNSVSPYAALVTDLVLLVDLSGGAVEVDLPAATTARILFIADASGHAATNNLTLDPNGTDQINNAGAGTPLVLKTNNVSLILISNGVDNYTVF